LGYDAPKGAGMSAFELAFSFFGLILGFALVEVLSGLVRATRERGKSRHFYLVGALGLLVSLDLITYWSSLFGARDFLPANTLALYVGFVISAGYYWAASQIFPDRDEAEIDLDQHYFRVRRKVIGAILACNIALYVALTAALGRPVPLAGNIEIAGFMLLFVALVLVRTKRASAVLLTLTILAYLASAVARSA
jgi:hypothetical protein